MIYEKGAPLGKTNIPAMYGIKPTKKRVQWVTYGWNKGVGANYLNDE
jgi:hypothetical protein